MKVIKYIRKEYKDIKKGLLKRTAVFNRKKILHKKYRKISFIVIALLVIVNMTIFTFNALSQMGVQEANSLESYAVVAYTEPGSHTWTVPNGVSSVDVLVVAGGGGGGGNRGGGGGSGELVLESNYSVSPGENILIEVGNGGSGGANSYGGNGQDSSFDTIVANGGGGGAPHGSIGNNGGSGGGGGCDDNNGGASIVNEGSGNVGGYGPDNWSNTGSAGGGGGAGSVGLTPDGGNGYIDYPGNGGDGMYFGDVFGDQYGENGWFAGGGGGGTEGNFGATNNSPYERPIGMAGGGDGGMIEYVDPVDPGSSYNQHSGTDAVDGTGSGGGGGNYANTLTTYGGNGGSGIVLIRYKVNLGTLQGSTLNKGLVGHWTMDEDEYVEGTENLVPNADMQSRSHTDYYPVYNDNYIGGVSLRNDSGNKSQYVLINDIPIVAGEVYTITTKHYFSEDFDAGLRAAFAYELSNGKHHNLFGTKKGEWETKSLTFTAETTGDMRAALYMSGPFTQGYVIVDWIQVEKKDHATPFANGIRNGRLTEKTPYSNHGDTGIEQSFSFAEDRFGKAGGAMSFDGVDDYITIPGSDFYSSDADSFSIAAWIKPVNFNQQSTIFGDRYGSTMTTGVRTSGKIYLNMDDTRGSTACESNASLIVNEWSHVVFRYDGTSKEVSFYINGQQDTKGWSYCYDSNGCGDSSTYYLGKDNRFFYRFEGLLEDVRTYNRILSESEIQSLYDSYEPKIRAGSLNKGLVLDMPLTLKYTKNETAGSEIMTDKTPYSNDGQNFGATITAEGANFNGAGDYVLTSSLDSMTDFTMSFWTKWNNYGTSNVQFILGGDREQLEIHTGGSAGVNGLRFISNTHSASTLDVTNAIPDNNYNHYTIVYTNNDKVIAYRNGIEIGRKNHTVSTPTNANSLNIGRRDDGTYNYNGDISNVKIYSRALSDTEVKSLYDKGRDSGSGMTIKPYGSVPGMAGLSCLDILNNNPGAINNDGLYWVNPEGDNPFQVYCDMTTDGGGWTAVWKNFGGPEYASFGTNVSDQTLWANPSTYNSLATPYSYSKQAESVIQKNVWDKYIYSTNVDWLKHGDGYDVNGNPYEYTYNGGGAPPEGYSHPYRVKLDFGSGVTMNDVMTAADCATLNNQVGMLIYDDNYPDGYSYGSTDRVNVYAASSKGFANSGDTCGQTSTNLMNGWGARHVLSYNYMTTGRDTLRCQFECWGTTPVMFEAIWFARESN